MMEGQNLSIEPASQEPESLNIYKEYDDIYCLTQLAKRRVHFEETVQESAAKGRKIATTPTSMDSPGTVDPSEVPTPQQPSKATREMTERECKKSQKGLQEAARRGLLEPKKTKEPEEVHDLYKDDTFVATDRNGVKIYSEDQYVETKDISEVSDFTLATFLMERKVVL